MNCKLSKEELQLDWLMFDFDNTLVDFHEASKLAFDQCFKDYDLRQDAEYYQVYKKINAQVWADFEEKKITTKDIREIRFTKFLKHIGVTQLDGLEFNTTYLNNLVKFTRIRPEVKVMLEQLNKKYKLSIITNGLKEVQRPRLDKCGITSLFDSIIVSDEIGVAKPDTLFFDAAMASIDEKIEKQRILVIGDSLKSDIAGAKEYGIRSCYINADIPTILDADIVISDVLQLENVLDDFYIPVNCDWYDYLEIYSMKKMEVEIHFKMEGKRGNFRGRILNLETKNKEEFAILSDGSKLRLDKIESINVL